MTPKVLLFDLETSPLLLYGWQLHEEIHDPKFVRRNWFVLCWAAKWYDKKEMFFSSLPKYRGYTELPSKTEADIDKGVMLELWKLLDETDIVIAHNLKSFDRKKANTRFIINGMSPPSTYEMIDTLTEARKEFKFTSNKLGYLSDKLCVTKKMDPGGFDLWLGCEAGDEKAWNKMGAYCRRDILSLQDVYTEIRPYIRNHAPVNVFGDGTGCSHCGAKNMKRDGFRHRMSGVYQRFRCNECGTPYIAQNPKKENIINIS